MGMIFHSGRMTPPRRLENCTIHDPVARKTKRWALLYRILSVCIPLAILVVTIVLANLVDNEWIPEIKKSYEFPAILKKTPTFISAFGILVAALSFLRWNAIAVNLSAQVRLLENVHLCADLSMYEAYKKEGRTPDVVAVSAPAPMSAPARNYVSAASASSNAPAQNYAPTSSAPASASSNAPARNYASTSSAAAPISMGAPTFVNTSAYVPAAGATFAPAAEPFAPTMIKTTSGNTLEFIHNISAVCGSCGNERVCGEYRVIMPDGRNSKISHYCDECVAKMTVGQ